MMAQKHLHELLKEDQEPFVLKKFIADRRCQLKNPSPKRTHLQIKKRKPQNFSSNLCKNACFFADSSKKSPLFEFQSPIKSPCKSPIFLQIPSRTASLLLEAALRIQKQSSKTKNNGGSFNLFGSILKRITNRYKSPKREIGDDGAEVLVKDILRWESKNDKQRQRKTLSVIEDHQSGRPSSSAVWSEKSMDLNMDMDLDTSCSCSQSEDFEEIFISKYFCESPFHFVLQNSPSFCHGTPLLSSPTTSPSRRQKEGKENYEAETSKKLQVEEAEEEEEKDQCSPVSVLDPPFEDDDNRHIDDDDDDDDDDEDDDEIDDFDLESSYANMQRAKQQLLHKLRRFEKLAELDPVELEKRMLEDEDDSGICDLDEEEELENESVSSNSTEMIIDAVIKEVFKSSFRNPGRVPDGMKRLVYDLVAEEETDDIDRETVAKRVCKRLESWKDVESNTIDMMVGQDFRRLGWKGDQEQIKETASQLEYAIFGLLMAELSEELVCLAEI